MRRFWKKLPFSYKLFFGILSAILLTLFFLLFYIRKYETTLLINKFEKTLQKEARLKNEQITKYFDSLFHEISFLSKLEIMDDLIVKDTDRRITRLLELKTKDLGNSIVIVAIAPNGIAYASSEKRWNLKIFPPFKKLIKSVKRGKHYFFDRDKLYFFTPIYSSFEKKLFVGYLILIYPLSNLSDFSEEKSSVIVRMIPPKETAFYLKDDFFKNITANRDKFVIVERDLKGILKGWKILYASLKSDLFSTLYHMQKILINAFFITIVLITILIWLTTSKITNPLRYFVKTIEKIIKTKNYKETLPIEGEDEIAKLSLAFNHLMKETQKAFEKLKEERKEHLETLLMLINFFFQITSSKNREETISNSIKEIKKFGFAKKVFFSEKPSSIALAIEIMDIESSKNATIGYINVEEPQREWMREEVFKKALSKIISLQIQRIDLLEHTKSVLKAKNSFFSSMSHELKTPLGSILSLTQTMMREEKEQSKIENLAKIEEAAYDLLTTINDILDFARVESGKINLNPENLNLCETIEEVLDLLMPLASLKNMEVSFECEENITIKSDKKLLKHLVSNLISNSIKFTEEGFVKIEASRQNGIVRITVSDSGIGIDPHELKKIFEEFYRIRENEEGSGLGLALAKKIATLLKGELSIYSQGKGKGTKAVFTFRSF